MAEIAITWQRVSTDAQETVNQKADIAAYVEAKGYQVVRAFEVEGASAFHGKHQSELDAMLRAIPELGATVVVVWHSDRLERRGARELLNLLDAIKTAGARVESVKEPELGAASMGGQIMTFLGGLMAHAESAHKSDRIKAKHAHLRAIGSWASGKAPFGYDIVTLADGRKTLAPNADAPTVARAFEMTAEGMSYGQISRAFAAEGLDAPGGNAVWNGSVVGQIVRNPVFRGLVNFEGHTYMTVEPLVSSDLWLRANASIKGRSASKGYARRNKGGRPSPKLLRPVCAECGAPLYVYGLSYRCAGLPSNNYRGCGNTIKVAVLDAEVLAYFAGSDEPEVITRTIEGTDYAEEIAAVVLARKDLDDFADDYDERYAELTAELRRLRALPVEPTRYEETETGRTEGDAFADLGPEGQRDWLRTHYVIRVYPEPILWQGRVTRWTAGHLGGVADPQADEILAGDSPFFLTDFRKVRGQDRGEIALRQ
jgi:DNA invertase Pin-like site-specific DNA recombinase